MVTRDACGHYVLPGVGAAPVPRNNVVDGKVPPFTSTILAGVGISDEYVPAGKASLKRGSTYQVPQSDDRWYWER